jgi:2-oxoisovalerate dehydrogenase E1 component alpha subunit
VFLGALAKGSDPHSGGRQLTAHFSSPRLGIGTVSSVVAGHATHAVGAAYAARVLGQDSVALCSFGDGAASSGGMHEAMNLAAVQRLPVVFVCQNNGWAISVPQELQMPIDSLAKRAQAYGMPGVSVDGFDALAVYEATQTAIEHARKGEGPTLIEARVYRFSLHTSHVGTENYREQAEIEAARRRDPIVLFRRYLEDYGLLSEGHLREIREEVERTVDAAVAAAERSPAPGPSTALEHVFGR